MNDTDWLTLTGIGITIITSIVGGVWALYRFRRASPYKSDQARRYEEVYQQVCIDTLPQMSSYEAEAGAHRLCLEVEELPPGYRQLVSNPEYLDRQFCASVQANPERMLENVVRGELALNNNRLYIDKEDRDLFRDFLVLASAFANATGDGTLNQLFDLRGKLTVITANRLKSSQN